MSATPPEEMPLVCKFCGGLADLVAGFQILTCPCGSTVSSVAVPVLEGDTVK